MLDRALAYNGSRWAHVRLAEKLLALNKAYLAAKNLDDVSFSSQETFCRTLVPEWPDDMPASSAGFSELALKFYDRYTNKPAPELIDEIRREEWAQVQQVNVCLVAAGRDFDLPEEQQAFAEEAPLREGAGKWCEYERRSFCERFWYFRLGRPRYWAVYRAGYFKCTKGKDPGKIMGVLDRSL